MVQSQDGLGVLLDERIISFVALSRGGSSRVARVKVPCDELLSAFVGDLANEVVVVAVRRPQERGSDTEETLEGLFDQPELVVDLVVSQGGEILVVPGVGRDHVSLCVSVLHTLDVDFVIDTTV